MIFPRIRHLLFGTLRRQLIVAVAAVHALMMSLFVWDLTTRQEAMLIDQQTGQASALAQSVATSSAVWLAARDFAGLQEIIEAQQRYPELNFAMILDRRGEVLAHSEPARRGQFVHDLPPRPVPEVLSRSPDLVDVTAPVVLVDRHIGWVRVGIGQRAASTQLADTVRNGLFYALAAVLIGTLLAALLATYLTRRLHAIRAVADGVQAGDTRLRVQASGSDEAAQLARRFDRMLDTLAAREQELVASQTALHAGETRFRSIIEASPVPYALNDDLQNITYLNPAFVRTFGYTREDIPTLADWWPRAYPDPAYRLWVATEWTARLERARVSGSAFEAMEINICAKDGSVHSVMASAAALGQAFSGTHLVILFDITDLKKAERALRESEEHIRLTVEAIQDYAIMRIDTQGRVASWNAGAERINGYRSEEVLGQPMALFYPPEAVAAGEPARLLALAQHQGHCEDEGWRVRKDGSRFQARVTITALRGKQGELLGFSKVTRDITERKRAEERILALNSELEQRVKDRTAALEAANKELEAFSYSVSHDLRAPLRAIDGFGRILSEDYAGLLNTEARGYLERMRNAAQRTGVLIDELLELSRVGRAVMHNETIDLSALAAEVVAQLRAGEPARAVQVDIAPDIAAQGDVRLLRLVLENLLGNAWKYTARATAAHIRFGATDQGGEQVYCVQDNGAGFDMRYAGKLFRPFQRLHTAQEFTGSGIGLATVARIIHRHGGRVWGEGEVDRGASFCFTLGTPLDGGVAH
jgi:PAS domain S-box-containing protein